MKGKGKQLTADGDLAKRLANLRNGRDEMNLCEFPFATLSERNTGRSVLNFEISDQDMGQEVRRRLTVTGDPKYGLPTQRDEEIYLGLLKYSSDDNSLSHPEVRMSRSALFELMGWPKTSASYNRLTLGMHRLVGVRLSYENMWRDNRHKQWRDQGAFAILDSFSFRDRRTTSPSGAFEERTALFRWGSVIFQSFESNYVKKIDYGLVRSLNGTARRLYRFLDKHFHPPKTTQITIDLTRLAYQHVGVAPSIALDKAKKREIGPAADELVKAGYLRPAKADRFTKVRRGVWNVTFELAPQHRSVPVEADPVTERLVKALRKRGVSQAMALQFAATYEPAKLQQAIQAMDNSKTPIRSPDRWTYVALEKDYGATDELERAAKRPERKLFRRQAAKIG